MNTLQVGGAVRVGAPYAPRAADTLLPQLLAAAQLCYVLAPRQIGKSSLRVRAAEAMRAAGYEVASVDLSAVGTSGLSISEWFLGLSCEIADALGWEDPMPAWQGGDGRSPAQRWLRSLERGLASSPRPVVIFIDEIDAVRALPFSGDDFFAAIRATMDLRATESHWRKLTFCLLGVASPTELIADVRRTPFNVGVPVALDDLAPEEARALLPALSALGGDADAALHHTLSWSGGHPYQTNQILQALLTRGQEGGIEQRVRAVVEALYLGTNVDPALLAAGRALLDAGLHTPPILSLYRQVIEGEAPLANERDPLHAALRLTGLVAARGGRLVPRNRVTAMLFDRAWVDTQQGHRLLREWAWRWVRGGRRSVDLPTGADLRSLGEWAAGRSDLEREESELLLRAEAEEARTLAFERSRRFLGLIGALTLVAIVVGGWAWRLDLEARHLLAVRALSIAIDHAHVPGQSEATLREVLESWSALQRTDFAGQATRSVVDVMQALRGTGFATGHPHYTIAIGKDAAYVGGRGPLWVMPLDGGEPRSIPELSDVRALSLSPDGQSLLVGRLDESLTLVPLSDPAQARSWRVPVGEPLTDCVLSELGEHLGGAREVQFTPSGERFYWITSDGQLHTSTGGDPRSLAQGERITRVRPLGEDRLLTAGADGTLALRDLDDRVLARWGPWANPSLLGKDCTGDPEFTSGLVALELSPDGRRAAAVGRAGAAVILDLESGQILQLGPSNELIQTVQWSGDGATLVTSFEFGRMQLWDSERGLLRLERSEPRQSILTMALSPDGALLATGGHDDLVRLWDLRAGDLRWETQVHTGIVWQLAFSGDGDWLYSASQDGRIGRFAVGPALNGGHWQGGPGNPSGMSLNEDVLAVAWTEAPLQLLPLRPGGDLSWAAMRGEPTEDVHFTPIGALLSTVRGLWLYTPGRPPVGPLAGRTMSRFNPWSPAAKAWISRDAAGTVHAYDERAEAMFSFPAGHELLSEPVFSPDGRAALILGADGSVSVYDLASGALRALGSHAESVVMGAWSPDGRRVATVSRDNSLVVWDARAGGRQFQRDLGGNGWTVQWQERSPQIIVGQQNGQVSFWSDEGELLAALAGHRGALRSVATSGDGRVLATAAEDGEVRLWEIPTGALLARYPTHQNIARTVLFSTDDRWVYSAGDDGQIFRLPGRSSEIIAVACAWLGLATGGDPGAQACEIQ